MKIVFVYELLHPPFDEGVKKLAAKICENLEFNHDVTKIRYSKGLPNWLNSLMLVPRILARGLINRPDKIVFIPQASLTFSSYIKIFALRLLFGSKLTIVGTQRRVLAGWQARLVSLLRFKPMFVLSSSMARDLAELNIQSEILTVGIDRGKYKPVADKSVLRKKYKIRDDARVILHVGHIRQSRNISWLLEISEGDPNLQVVLIGSTSTDQDRELVTALERQGVLIFSDYLPAIEEIYQLADYYVFPVTLHDAAMETPLSVLEAMATNLPVLTTRFGRLPEQFPPDNSLRYVDSARQILDSLNSEFGSDCANRPKTKTYTWQASAERLLQPQQS